MFIVSPFITAVSATKDYNSSKSNTFAISKMEDIGLDEAGIERILDAFDDEIEVYKDYNDAKLNTLAVMKRGGVSDVDAERIISDIRIGDDTPTGVTITIKWCGAVFSGGPPDENVTPQGSGDPLHGLNVYKGKACKKEIGPPIGIDEEGIHGIEIALNDEIHAYKDYNTARLNTLATIKDAGITDEAKRAEILDSLYEPVKTADAIYDTINQAMVDFPLLGKIFGNEKMNVYVREMAPFNVVTRNGRVENLNPGETEAPTMRVYSDMGTVNQLIAGEVTPLAALMEGKIRYEGVGFVKSIKIRVLKFASKLLYKFDIGVEKEKTEEKVSIQKTTTPPPTTQPSTTSPPTTPPPTTLHITPVPPTSTGNCTNISVGPNLFDRGGLIYDADRDITWLQDANYAQTSGYDTDGKMNWDDAMAWADSLDYGGFDDWRLPAVVDTGSPGCDSALSGTDCGLNVDTSTGEMAHLWYDELGNLAFADASGQSQTGGGLSNTGPFTNIQSWTYWSGTEHALYPNIAWAFRFDNGYQGPVTNNINFYAWPVRDGDVCAPPTTTTPPTTTPPTTAPPTTPPPMTPMLTKIPVITTPPPTTLPPLTLPPVSESPITPIPVRPKNCIQPPSGLVSWWPGDGDANDIWDANPGTLAGDTTFAAGMVGQAFSFDGSRDYVDVENPANLQVTGPHSAFAWVKLDSTKAEQDVVSKYAQLTSGSFTREFLLMVYNGRVRGHIGSTALSGATPLSTGTWYFIGQVWDGTALRVYVNGAEDGSISAGAPTTGDSKFFIGARTQNGTDVRTSAVMNGLIEEVQIFNRALTPAEILAEYNAGSAGKCKGVSEVDLGIEKTVSDSNPEEGDIIGYSITLNNPNNLTVTGVVVTDLLPAGVTFNYYQASTGTFDNGTGVWNVGTIDPYTYLTLYISVTVDSGTTGQTITNTAELTNVDQGDSNSANNIGSAEITVGTTTQPDLSIVKFQNGDFHYGQSGSYTLMVENLGNGPADSPITVVDVLPDGFTFDSFYDPYSTDWSCFVSGQVVTCTYNGPAVSPSGFLPTLIINVTIDPVDEFPGGSDAVENCATVRHPDDTNSANDESCVQTIITSL